MSNHFQLPRLAFWLVLLITTLQSTGCITDNRVLVRSSSSSLADQPALTTAAFLDEGSGGASIFLTDLSSESLVAGTDVRSLTGRIVQIRMFLTPAAGSTPIGRAACTATVRHVVLVNGSIGVYGGAGFLWPKGKTTDQRFGGSMEGTPLRLTGSTPSFSDRLGACTFDCAFSAQRDESLARRISGRIDDILLLIGQSPATPK